MKNYNSIIVIGINDEQTVIDDLLQIEELEDVIIGVGKDSRITFNKDFLTSWTFRHKSTINENEQSD